MASGDQKKRGIAWIIVNEAFENSYVDKREGAKKDQELLEKLFQDLQFDIRKCYDQCVQRILDEAREIAKFDHGKYDCLVVAVSTHGEKQKKDVVDNQMEGYKFIEEVHYLAARDVWYETKSLTEIFCEESCGSLAGKPKLFFIQACRGKDICKPVTIETVDKAPTEDLTSDGIVSTGPVQIPVELIISRQQIIKRDFLVMWASPHGYKAYRNTVEGSYFIRYLNEELARDHAKESLLTILTNVNQKLATNTECTVVGEVEHMLLRNPIFNILCDDSPSQDLIAE